ncbi:MAG: hypothetical protein OES57_15455 [Acidimicrobiia bacterium]|nr:hypothetical protein [Acidimicrobiia bacterium]
MTSPTAPPRTYYLEIALISFAALLLEISYTRIISFKLYYYWTFLVLGLALLGIGSGGVFVAVSLRIRSMALDRLLMFGCLWGAVTVAAGFLVVAWLPVNTTVIWDYWTAASFYNLAKLVLLCLALFATFVSIGIMLASLLGRTPDNIARLYFADLLGAGLACFVVVFMLGRIGPVGTIFAAGAILAATGAIVAQRTKPALALVAVAVGVALAVGVVAPDSMPDPRVDDTKEVGTDPVYSEWGPVFRVDVQEEFDGFLSLYHDGLFGSAIYEFDGDVDGLTRFESNVRRFPFEVLGEPPANELIIGAAGGHEILASLYFEADQIDAVELNPVTYDLLTDRYAAYSGNIATRPGVNYVNDDGRSFLARSDTEYDLIWFVAPDSYSASNAASSGAFVLSESYLYTREMVRDSLEHLSDRGVITAQFGEFVFDEKPNRTARYVATARAALSDIGVPEDEHHRHILVATSRDDLVPLSTIMVKRTPFTDEELARFVAATADVEETEAHHLPGATDQQGTVALVATATGDQLDDFYAEYPFQVGAIDDNGPFFWHFSSYRDVLADLDRPLDVRDPEDSLGERVLLLLFAVAVVMAAVFLLLPFVAIRDTWSKLPYKGLSMLYFSALGLGFIFYEITLIQKLVLMLGYPTYSLTVTLASILVFTGLGSLLSSRWERNPATPWVLLGALVVLTAFYRWGLDPIAESLLDESLAVRVLFAFLAVAPLGLVLGAFMPLGLRTVAVSTEHHDEYVAWGWAVNGFFSVIGSVGSTILSMAFGFETVLTISLVLYIGACITLYAMRRRMPVLAP